MKVILAPDRYKGSFMEIIFCVTVEENINERLIQTKK